MRNPESVSANKTVPDKGMAYSCNLNLNLLSDRTEKYISLDVNLQFTYGNPLKFAAYKPVGNIW